MAYNKKSYEKVKEEIKEKGILPPNEEDIANTLQKKSYNKIRNEKREIKENT